MFQRRNLGLILLTLSYYAVHVLTEDTPAFVVIEGADNNKYWLSSFKDSFSNARKFCASIGSTMPMFESNSDLSQVLVNLNNSIRQLWLDLGVRDVASSSQYWLLKEELNESFWTSKDNDDNRNDASCYYILLPMKKIIFLEDDCNERLYNFMCRFNSNLSEALFCNISNSCSHLCQDAFPGYICACPKGLVLSSDNKTCVDVDECERKSSNCSHLCVNTHGSYNCACPIGYSLHGNTCADVDECETSPCPSPDSYCHSVCFNTIGSYECLCQKPDVKTSFDKCPCSCSQPVTKYTSMVEEFNLKLKKSNLSSYHRGLTSIEDPRVSAVAIGYLGVLVLIVCAVCVVLLDLHSRLCPAYDAQLTRLNTARDDLVSPEPIENV